MSSFIIITLPQLSATFMASRSSDYKIQIVPTYIPPIHSRLPIPPLGVPLSPVSLLSVSHCAWLSATSGPLNKLVPRPTPKPLCRSPSFLQLSVQMLSPQMELADYSYQKQTPVL